MFKAAHISSKYPKLRKRVNDNVNKILLYFSIMFICNVSYTGVPKVENATNMGFFLIEGNMGLRQHNHYVEYYKED